MNLESSGHVVREGIYIEGRAKTFIIRLSEHVLVEYVAKNRPGNVRVLELLMTSLLMPRVLP